MIRGFIFTLLIFTINLNSIFSQEDKNKQQSVQESDISIQDYYNYIYNVDKRKIKLFGSQRNQTVVSINEIGDRKYSVTYLDNFTSKITDGFYNGNQNRVLSFENFKGWEIERRKEEEEQRKIREKKRLEEIKLERKREVERKKKIREEKIKKEKERINSVRTRIFYNRGSEWKEFKYYFFLNGMEPIYSLKSNLIIEFIPNNEFIKRDVILTDEIEEIGKLIVTLKEDPKFKVFEMVFGVKNLHDNSKLRYYVDGIESNYNFGLKSIYNGGKPLNHLINFYSVKGNVYKKFSKKFNLPFNTSIKDFDDLNDFSHNYRYLKFLNEIKYTGKYKKLVNYITKEKVDYWKSSGYRYGDWEPQHSYEIIDVKDSKKKFSWIIKQKSNNTVFTKYIFHKKKGVLFSRGSHILFNGNSDISPSGKIKWNTYSYPDKGKEEISEIIKGNYEFSSVMNSN